MRVIFDRTYNHRWPSRAVTEFRPAPQARTVRREVGEAAILAGKARVPTDEEIEGEHWLGRALEDQDASGAGTAGGVVGQDHDADGTEQLGDGDGLLADRGAAGAPASSGG